MEGTHKKHLPAQRRYASWSNPTPDPNVTRLALANAAGNAARPECQQISAVIGWTQRCGVVSTQLAPRKAMVCAGRAGSERRADNSADLDLRPPPEGPGQSGELWAVQVHSMEPYQNTA